MISCILLCGGKSERFGSPKALAQVDGKKTIIEIIQKTLLLTKLDEIVIVLGANSTSIEPYLLKHERIKSVYNKDFNLGQTSSFKAGLKSTNPLSNGFALLPIDCPFIKSETIDFLSEGFLSQDQPILIPSYQNRKGHPPFFHSKLKDQMLEIPDSQGLNEFEHRQSSNIKVLPVSDPGILKTFNTPQEFEEIKRNFIT